MEKRQPGRTITIKINGKHQAFEETRQRPKPQENQPEEQGEEETPNSSVAIENTIPITPHHEAAAALNNEEESFDWILPQTPAESPQSEKSKEPPTKKLKQKQIKKSENGKSKVSRGIFATIFMAVFLAVLLGTSFGFTMLKLVFIEKGTDSSPVQETSTQPQKTVPNQPSMHSVVLSALS